MAKKKLFWRTFRWNKAKDAEWKKDSNDIEAIWMSSEDISREMVFS